MKFLIKNTMKNQTVNLINLYSGIGFSLLSIFISGLESRAESLNSLKNNSVSNKIKWVSYDTFSKDKKIGTAIEESKEPNVQLITNANKEEISENIEDENIVKINQKPNLLTTSSSQQTLESSKNIFIASKKEEKENNVLIAEIIIEGWEDHPEGRKLELAAYDSMSIKPGSIVDNQVLNQDLNAIYASGWFSGVKIESTDGPLGVRLIVNVVPNPILKKVELNPISSIISNNYVDDIFSNFYGTTLNLIELQNKIDIIKKRYESEGYSLVRISGPDRISKNGIVKLNVSEGIISDIKLRFPGSDGESIIEGKPREGKTKDWVIKRELKTQPGTVFNRKTLEADIGRLYATSLFDDVKVSLGPDNLNPGQIIIFLDLSELRSKTN